MKKNAPVIILFILLGFARLGAQSCLPSITVYNGFTVNVLPASGPDDDLLADVFQATVQAKDFVRQATSPCNQPLEYRIRRAGFGSGVPSTVDLSFKCDELGVQLVEIWAGPAGATTDWTYAETYVIVQDAFDYCSDDPQFFSLDCGESDVIPPDQTLLNGLSVALQPQPDGSGLARVSAANLIFKKSDNCPGPIKSRIRKSGTGAGVPTTTSVTFNCDELGTQPVEIWSRDVHGNWIVGETYVNIAEGVEPCGTIGTPGCSPDKTAPDVLLFHGFAINTVEGTATARAKSFTRQRQDNCSGLMTVRIEKDMLGSTPPSTSSVTFDCSELGTQSVNIWVGDESGNWSRTPSYIIVQDNTGDCGNSPKVAIPEWKQLRATQSAFRDAKVTTEYAVDGLSAQPNPTAGSFTLTGYLEQDDYVQVELYNALGQQVRLLSPRQWQETGDLYFSFEIGDLPTGLYRCAIRTGSGVQTVNVVKN